VGNIRIKLKRSAKKKPSRPYAVAKLKDLQTSRRYELELSDGPPYLCSAKFNNLSKSNYI